jgi:type II secretory pathway component PulC
MIPLAEGFADQWPADPQLFAKHGQWQPYSDDKGTRGVQVTNMASGSLFIRLGLKSGDIVTDIDGVSPSGPEDIQTLIEDLKVYPTAEVMLLRDGKPLTIRYVEE